MAWKFNPPPHEAGTILIAALWEGKRVVIAEDASDWIHLHALHDVTPYAWQPMPEAPKPLKGAT